MCTTFYYTLLRVPVAGSAYTYAYTSLGEGLAWFIGWDLTLEYGIAASAIARGWAGYVVSFFNEIQHPIPSWAVDIPLGGGYSGSLLTLIIIAICTLIVLSGVKESAKMNFFITCWNIALLVFIIITGFFFIDTKV